MSASRNIVSFIISKYLVGTSFEIYYLFLNSYSRREPINFLTLYSNPSTVAVCLTVFSSFFVTPLKILISL